MENVEIINIADRLEVGDIYELIIGSRRRKKNEPSQIEQYKVIINEHGKKELKFQGTK